MAATGQQHTHILVTEPSEGVRLLRLNRVEKLNAFSGALRSLLVDQLEQARADNDVRAVLIAGSARAFVSGADLSEVVEATPGELENADLHRVWDLLDSYPKPVVMAVRGYCFGAGCELLMHGDIGIVADDASIGQPEIRVGIQPGAGGLSRLVALVGYHRAMLLAMTGETITGAMAARWGLASESLPSDEVEDRALSIAATLAKLSAPRLHSIKRVARQGLDRSLTEQLAHERRAFWESFGTPDQREGMTAFLAKRPPQFNRG